MLMFKESKCSKRNIQRRKRRREYKLQQTLPNKLPSEHLMHIFSFLSDRDKWNLSKTCNQFYTMLDEVLIKMGIFRKLKYGEFLNIKESYHKIIEKNRGESYIEEKIKLKMQNKGRSNFRHTRDDTERIYAHMISLDCAYNEIYALLIMFDLSGDKEYEIKYFLCWFSKGHLYAGEDSNNVIKERVSKLVADAIKNHELVRYYLSQNPREAAVILSLLQEGEIASFSKGNDNGRELKLFYSNLRDTTLNNNNISPFSKGYTAG